MYTFPYFIIELLTINYFANSLNFISTMKKKKKKKKQG
jgi:hypothetical protein